MRAWINAIRTQAGLRETIERFPLAIASAGMACCLLFLTVPPAIMPMGNVWLLLNLLNCGFLWFWAAALIAESRQWRGAAHGALAIAGIAVIALILLQGTVTPANRYDYMLLAQQPNFFIAHILLLIIMAAPFLDYRADNDRFWHYNYATWVGSWTANVTATVLALGLALAVAAIDYLFELQAILPFKYIFIICLTFLAPLYTLYWVPKTFDRPVDSMPRACAILTQYILAPLLCLYFAILYAYLVRIALHASLPKGGVAIIVAGFGTLGTIFYLAAWPLRDTGNALLRLIYAHFFKVLVLPLLAMAVAFYARWHAYGMTEPRYYVALTCVWLACCTGIFLRRSDRKPLKAIPLILAVLLTIASIGPLSADAVSLRSQLHRFNVIAARYNLMFTPASQPRRDIPDREVQQLSAVLDYVYRHNDRHALPGALATATTPQRAMELMGLAYGNDWSSRLRGEQARSGAFFNVSTDASSQAIDMRGYNFVLTNSVYVSMPEGTWRQAQLGNAAKNIPGAVMAVANGRDLTVAIADRQTLTFDLLPAVTKILQACPIPSTGGVTCTPPAIDVDSQDAKGLKIRVTILEASGHRMTGQPPQVTSLRLRILAYLP